MDLIRWFSNGGSSQTPRTVQIVPKEGVIIPGLNDRLERLEGLDRSADEVKQEAEREVEKTMDDKVYSNEKRKITIYEKMPKNKENKNVDVNKQKLKITYTSKYAHTNKMEKPKEHNSILIRIPYKKIDMIRILQDRYEYEIKGTFYFDDNLKFQSFEMRTNLDPKSAEGSSEWALFFHTHPKKTAERLGLPYFSPPSVEDVMEIYDRTLRAYDKTYDKSKTIAKTGRKRLGETSVIFTSEGIWILQVDHKAFLNMVRRTFGGKMPDDEILELILNETYNGFLVETLREINPNNNDLLNGRKAPDRILELLARLVSDQYGFNLRFVSWLTLEQRKELSFTTQVKHLEIVE